MTINSQIQDKEFCPHISTEETIVEQLVAEKDNLPSEFELMPYPLAHWINTKGLKETNALLPTLHSDKRRVFICQHILVNKLQFKNDDLIFTPHAHKGDRFFSIPHYTVNSNKELIKEKKEKLFSFIGSPKTHKIRQMLISLYPKSCFNSNKVWGLDLGLPESFKNSYAELMGNSTFSLCPRGTGISSVRLFEAMSMNSIPVIIADGYKKPLEDIVDWSGFSVAVAEKDVDKIGDILSEYSEEEINKMRDNLSHNYRRYFSNENLAKTIAKTLK